MFCTAPVNVASGTFGAVAPEVEGILPRPPGMGRPYCENAGNPKTSRSRMLSPHDRGSTSITTSYPCEDVRADVKCNRLIPAPRDSGVVLPRRWKGYSAASLLSIGRASTSFRLLCAYRSFG